MLCQHKRRSLAVTGRRIRRVAAVHKSRHAAKIRRILHKIRIFDRSLALQAVKHRRDIRLYRLCGTDTEK